MNQRPAKKKAVATPCRMLNDSQHRATVLEQAAASDDELNDIDEHPTLQAVK